VVWVRQFGRVFGNTLHSASIVVAIFMVGLGVGGYLFGRLADRGYRARPDALVRLYAIVEALVALLGLLISFALPHLAGLVALLSAYDTGADGWHTLTVGSHLWRAAVATALLAPITVLMGGTLTVLVRAFVRQDLRASGSRVARLYGANTLGAAAGAFLTDFALVPLLGTLTTQLVAVALNVAAAAGALALTARNWRPDEGSRSGADLAAHNTPRGGGRAWEGQRAPTLWAATVLALSGFAALGMEILWLRHLNVLLGGFRAVFALLLTVMLLALGAGSLLGGWLDRRFGRPAAILMYVEALFAATTLLGLAAASAEGLAARGAALLPTLDRLSPLARWSTEIWFNVQPMLLEVAVPALIVGVSFPLANAIVHRDEDHVGRRTGVLYAANTAGAVCGSLVTGYVLLPELGMQAAAAVLCAVAAGSIVPLAIVQSGWQSFGGRMRVAGAGLIAVGVLVAWRALPDDYVVGRALPGREDEERLVALHEGATELLAVVERPGRGRGLLTNGHAMSSTATLDQRYMRALAHIPLLSMSEPSRVLVIGFGVGNTTHAASLHASVTRVDVADVSRQILGHASYFREANHDVLRDRKVSVFINDGRQHLEMSAPETYDLITLEPPPIAHAGVADLYSREFYRLARSRLTPRGYLSQWLPAYQVPAESSLAMVRSFIEVFPQSVLLSGAQAELLLVGTTGHRVELDPDRVAMKLETGSAVRADLLRVDLATLRDIAGTFVASGETLARATSTSPPVTDDRPVQEYGVRSGLTAGLQGVPAALFDVTNVAAWCPRCFEPTHARRGAANLDLYLRLLQQAYVAAPAALRRRTATPGEPRRILGSAYLGAVVPDSAEVHNLLGLAEAREGDVEDAVREFEAALQREPASANARANLGQIRYDQGAALLESRQFAAAAAMLRHAIALAPESAEAQNDLGVALASMGRVDEALDYFRRAVALEPEFTEARRNLESAERISTRGVP
jgi:predicted membrane-bound spermidine synthase